MTPKEHRALRKRIREHKQMPEEEVVADRKRASADQERQDRERFDRITGKVT